MSLEGIRIVDMTGVVFGPVATQALADWGSLKPARGRRGSRALPGPVRMLASAGFLDGEPACAARPASRLGQHTTELLRELGDDDTAIAAIAAMRAQRAAVAADTRQETP